MRMALRAHRKKWTISSAQTHVVGGGGGGSARRCQRVQKFGWWRCAQSGVSRSTSVRARGTTAADGDGHRRHRPPPEPPLPTLLQAARYAVSVTAPMRSPHRHATGWRACSPRRVPFRVLRRRSTSPDEHIRTDRAPVTLREAGGWWLTYRRHATTTSLAVWSRNHSTKLGR